MHYITPMNEITSRDKNASDKITTVPDQLTVIWKVVLVTFIYRGNDLCYIDYAMLHWLHSKFPCLHPVTLFTLLFLISSLTTVQTGPVDVMTLFVIDTITTRLRTVLSKGMAVTLCRISKH